MPVQGNYVSLDGSFTTLDESTRHTVLCNAALFTHGAVTNALLLGGT